MGRRCRWAAAIAIALCPLLAAQQKRPPQPSVALHGRISSADLHTFQSVPFRVPAGVRRIEVDFTHTGGEQGSVVFAGVEDPNGFRGWARPTFFLSDVEATASFVPGAIVSGTWSLVLGVDNIRPGNSVQWKADIYFETASDRSALVPPVVVNPRPGWYRGDLHAHTGHSDGTCTSQSGRLVPCPAFRLVEAAAARRLDFLAITDHNNRATFNFIGEMQPYFDRLLLLHGREITTFQGHANVWGTEQPVDFRLGYRGRSVDDLLDQVHRAGGLISINHAWWPDDERCPGCGWADAAHTDFSRVDAIEVVNGFNDRSSWFKPPPGNGIPFWEARLRQGHRVTAVGGSDDHRAGELLPDDGVGRPTTVVYASELSEPALLAGLRAGHAYVKMQPDGPDLFLEARAAGRTAMMGDNLEAGEGTEVSLSLRTVNGAGGRVEVFQDGSRVDLVADPAVRGADDTKTFALETDGRRHWVRAQLVSAAGDLLALTNPIYLNFRPRPGPRAAGAGGVW